MRSNFLVAGVAALALLITSSALCAERIPTVADLSRMQAQTIMLKAEAAQAKARSEMQEQLRPAGDLSPGATSSAEPVLLGIFGTPTSLYARFAIPSGAIVEARQGDSLMDGFKLTKLTSSNIELTRNGRKWQIRMPVPVQQDQVVMPTMQAAPRPSEVLAQPSLPAPQALPASSSAHETR
ncbi:type IV pilus biogenesis protein PilP [Stenotrophomonas maltophilia]|uniref:type IV pilus biogenesis protein PilP n=1 Tax=Stenotrophomonas maltophilia TaxID=40324 RepID=UPI001304111C|nr:type IV pilus biogenesis protein PilP [Stenotrophomonas maltophilia]